MSSFNQKIGEAFGLASQLADRLDDGRLSHLTMDSEDMDLVYGHVDGLVAKHLYNLRDGRCSIAASIAFDPEAEEVRLDKQILTMHTLLEK